MNAVLAEQPGVQAIAIGPLLRDIASLRAESRDAIATAAAGDALRTLPGVHPCDGFYAAVLERQE